MNFGKTAVFRAALLLTALTLTAVSPLSAQAILNTPVTHAPRYALTDLGTLPTYDVSFAWGLNAHGDVAGYCFSSPVQVPHAFLWRGGRMTDLGTLGGHFSLGNSVNNHNQVTGYSWTGHVLSSVAGVEYHAFLWERGKMRDLESLPGFPNSLSVAINDAGDVVGWSEIFRGPSSPRRAMLWRGGKKTALKPLPSRPDSAAHAVNAKGQIAGEDGRAGGPQVAVLWSGGSVMSLGSLAESASSTAVSLNDHGQILCDVPPVRPAGDPPCLPGRAFVFDHGRVEVLRPPPGFVSVDAARINNLGTVVGTASDAPDPADGHRVAVVYLCGDPVDLNTEIGRATGWTLERAFAVNDRGVILGAGTHLGHLHAFLLTPVATRDSIGQTPRRDHTLANAGRAGPQQTERCIGTTEWRVRPQGRYTLSRYSLSKELLCWKP